VDERIKEMRQRGQAVKPFIGLAGNSNLIGVKNQSRHIKIHTKLIARIYLSLVFFIFGPGITYIYFNHPEKWNQNLPLYINCAVLFFVVLGWIFFIRFSLLPRKILADKLNGNLTLYKYPWKKEVIRADQIKGLSIQDYVFRSSKSHRSTLCQILCADLNDGQKVGLFISSDPEISKQFLELYQFKSLQ
jgi:hypothetical protein